jgi:iron complex transport system substrate-binding protein
MEMVLKYPPQKIFVAGGRQALEDVLADKGDASNRWAGILADLGPDNIQYIPRVLFGWDRFGAESVLQLLWAARNIHPDIFADPASPDYIDLHKETKDFYANFAGYPITDEEAEDILNALPPRRE